MFQRHFLTSLLCGLTLLTIGCSSRDAGNDCICCSDSSQFVMLAESVPDAILEIRYYGTYNFVGTRIDGYQEPVALLTRRAADSLVVGLPDLCSQQTFAQRAVARDVFAEDVTYKD